MGWTVDALWAAPRVSLGFPHIWSDRRRSRFRGSSFHRRCCLPAYRIVGPQTSAGMPSAASRMGVGALPGAFPGKEGGPGLPKTRGNRRSDALLRSRTGEGVPPNAQNQVDVDPAVAPPCAHRARSHEARRPWPHPGRCARTRNKPRWDRTDSASGTPARRERSRRSRRDAPRNASRRPREDPGPGGSGR